jgi:hypothetical protein
MAVFPWPAMKPELQWGNYVPKLELGNEGPARLRPLPFKGRVRVGMGLAARPGASGYKNGATPEGIAPLDGSREESAPLAISCRAS